MATQTLSRMTVPANTFRALHNASRPTRSILKRPSPLPLSPSPLPLSTQFYSIHSPTSTLVPVSADFVFAIKSPHVHFPPSARLASTFFTHSPSTYDRAPISNSPSPLAMPARHDRAYSLTLEGFKLADPPRRVPLWVCRYDSPMMAAFTTGEVDLENDPRSPAPLGDLAGAAAAAATVGRMGSSVKMAALPVRPARAPTDLCKALTMYPRSPYPPAPISTEFVVEGEDFRPCSLDDHLLPVKPLEKHSVELSVGAKTRTHRKPAPLNLPQEVDVEEDGLSDEVILSATDSARLSEAFWESMSIEEPQSTAESYVTAVESPESLFATRNGEIWLFDLPRKLKRDSTVLPSSLVSPCHRTTFHDQRATTMRTTTHGARSLHSSDSFTFPK